MRRRRRDDAAQESSGGRPRAEKKSMLPLNDALSATAQVSDGAIALTWALLTGRGCLRPDSACRLHRPRALAAPEFSVVNERWIASDPLCHLNTMTSERGWDAHLVSERTPPGSLREPIPQSCGRAMIREAPRECCERRKRRQRLCRTHRRSSPGRTSSACPMGRPATGGSGTWLRRC